MRKKVKKWWNSHNYDEKRSNIKLIYITFKYGHHILTTPWELLPKKTQDELVQALTANVIADELEGKMYTILGGIGSVLFIISIGVSDPIIALLMGLAGLYMMVKL